MHFHTEVIRHSGVGTADDASQFTAAVRDLAIAAPSYEGRLRHVARQRRGPPGFQNAVPGTFQSIAIKRTGFVDAHRSTGFFRFATRTGSRSPERPERRQSPVRPYLFFHELQTRVY